jgi:putative tricarboxylic transport membrane protein
MKKKDLYCGITLLGLGAWIGWESSHFPVMAGMLYGPGLFPTIAAVGLSLCGTLILISSLLSTQSTTKTEKPTESNDRGYRATLNTFAVIVAVVFYAMLLEPVGFHIVYFLVLFCLFILLQIRLVSSFVLATGVTIIVHLIFYSFLHVPLPWGLLEPFAW